MPELIQGEQLIEIAKQYGTPVYVYYTEKIASQYTKLTTAFSSLNTRFFYASKALTNINILRFINSIGCNIDCSSINEVKLAIHAGFEPRQILYTSNGIAFPEIREAVAAGVHINIDSLSNLKKFGEAFGDSYPVGVRLRPEIMAGGNLKISTGHDASKFGIPVSQVNEVVNLANEYNLFIRTLHIHTGSDIKEAKIFVKGMEVLFGLLHLFPRLEVIDLGGGFKVPYQPGETDMDIKQLATEIAASFQTHLPPGKKFELWFEPGKFLVSECGFLVTQATVIKPTTMQLFAAVTAG